ncbi:MAG: ABC transporter permease [Planctomycetota bacterium]|jgi:ribose transport system permease protein|nr:ABC transporter permease [Planctomycetota bacterium]MDP6763421.1 ABC transporter permease [Planctomycetota bacterium]MDP6989066.1 ABC transporter permease [Planctomycetota bacterium]
MNKTLGILGLLVLACVATALINPQFVSAYNLQNVIRWTSLFGILSIGVAFVIITGGIDLSIGSVVGLVGCLLPLLMVEHGFSPAAAIGAVLGLSVAIGLFHGLLITKLGLQPFVVTLCGLLFYRGYARFVTGDQTQGFGTGFETLRGLATGKPTTVATSIAVLAAGALLLEVLRGRREQEGPRRGPLLAAGAVFLAALATGVFDPGGLAQVRAPAPFLIMIVIALAAGLFLNATVGGRYLYAIGRNLTAARYSGIDTDRIVIGAYVACSALAGLGGVLFALDVNSVQPAMHGNFYELYAIAAAVLGGCSLRGGEGTVTGVVIGAAVMRVLYNSINLLEIPTQLEFSIIGAVILLGVAADELVRRTVARRRRGGS